MAKSSRLCGLHQALQQRRETAARMARNMTGKTNGNTVRIEILLVLNGLPKGQGATIGLLAALLGLSDAVITYHTKLLENSSLLKRWPKHNGNQTLVKITRSGRAVLARLRKLDTQP